MCASVYSTLLLFICTTLTISIMCGTKMATEGLPLVRRERGAEPDILAGADFLSVFMESSLRQAYRETTTSAPTYPTFTTTDMEIESTEPLVRTSRSTNLDIAQQNDLDETTISAQDLYTDNTQEPSDNLSDGVIVAVRVSSSIGKTLQHQDMEGRTPSESYTETTTMYPDQNFVASEDHPSIVAEANKSEFSVEESEPIMRNTDLDTSEFSRSFPASVHALPRPQNLPFNPLSSSDYLDREIDDSKRPYHQTIVYHNNPRQPGRARSVSYSTVIQTVPHGHEKNWANDKANQNERHERNYDNANNYRNNFEDNEDKRKLNETAPPPPPTPVQSSVAESNNYFVTSKPLDKPTNWEKPEDNYEQPSTRLTSVTTERNWELQEKRYQPPTNHQQLPKVYGVPEQNYEVDEAISVVTNGRAHGIQPSQPPTPKKQEVKDQAKKDDDNQKVGYVVEGRNYRKYRVEERTADGFIVGEYGVVSHDDGSLRGVRYTADGTINPRLIYDALMKFLSL